MKRESQWNHRNRPMSPMTHRPTTHSCRQGVALLFVISLIVVFFLFTTTFVAMSTSYMRTSDRQLRIDRTDTLEVTNLVDDVFYMLIRDVQVGHPLHGHSLLGDQYGTEPFSVNDPSGWFVANAGAVAIEPGYSGQVLRVSLTVRAADSAFQAMARASRDDFLGRYLTFADGSLAGVTMPVLEYKFVLDNVTNPTAVTGHFFVLVQSQDRTYSVTPGDVTAMTGARFVVNGRPFDGTASQSNESFDVVSDDNGVLLQNRNLFLARDARTATTFPEQFRQVPSFHRYAGFTGAIDPANTTWEQLRALANIALRPSPLDNPNFTGSNPNARFFTPGQYGEYDRTPNYVFPNSGLFSENGFNSAQIEHWRHLINGLLGNDPGTLTDLNLALNSGLDVDNDGDGVRDSMWLDIGLPPVTMPNGTRVKPLVAIKIEDLDGRLNLNAHGSLAEVARGNSLAPVANVPYGQGYGPAEISLSGLLGNLGAQAALTLRYGTPLSGTPGIGAPDMPGVVNPLQAARWFGFVDRVLPNLAGGMYGTPSDYQGQLVYQPVGTSVNDGSYAAAFGPGYFVPPANPGMSLPFAQRNPAAPLLPQITDTPYEFNMFAEGSPYRYFDYATNPPTPFQAPPGNPDVDQPFSVADLEVLLRAFDADVPQVAAAALNQRPDTGTAMTNRRDLLEQVINAVTTNDNIRRQVTTHGFEVPALPGNIAGVLRRHLLLRDASGASAQIDTTLSHFQPTRAFLTPAGATNVATAVEQQVLAMLGQDIVSGLPMNLHRKFGNGVDDNGNLMIDEYGDPFLGPVESSTLQSAVTLNTLAGTLIDLDFDNDGSLPAGGEGDQFLARSAFARQLYVLMLMMVEPDYSIPTSALTPEMIRRRVALAQWAINVVDFSDADSICTPFEFDINPFNGWHVDGSLRTRPAVAGGLELGIEPPVLDPFDTASGPQVERFLVWGLERPDLLLTEASAFHDHRSRVVGMNTQQAHMPNPSAFIEIYNPNLVPFVDYQSQGDTHASLSTFEKGVDLRKVTPSGEPVYRMLVVKEEDRGLNPDRPISSFDMMSNDQEVNGNPRVFAQGGIENIERTIFFVNPAVLMNRIDQYITSSGADLSNPADPNFFLRVQLAKGEVQHFPSSLPLDVPFVVQPGHHAVVGSSGPHAQNALTRNTTIFGRIPGAAADDTYDPAVDSLDRPAIRLNPGLPIEVGFFDTGNANKMRLVPNTLGIPLDRVDPAAPEYRSFAVSDPLAAGYPAVDDNGDAAEAEVDGWRYNAPYSTPFYQTTDQDIAKYGEILDADDPSIRSYRHVVLQRLANPMQRFHPEFNPYLTMDDIAMNLNGFGGMGVDSELENNAAGVPGDAQMVSTMQRGRSDLASGAFAVANNPALINNVERKNVWLRTVDGTWEVDTIGGTQNGSFPTTWMNYDPVAGYASSDQFSLGAVNNEYLSQTGATVPWLRIANRPLISQFELASVPVQSNALLLEHVVWANPQTHNHYTDDAFLNTASNNGLRNNMVFPDLLDRVPTYLLNFYGQTVAMRSPARMFEYTSVPSPFVGTETMLNPLGRGAGGFGADTVHFGNSIGLPADGVRYGAPHNFLSNRRIPGKLNVNTVNRPEPWNAMMSNGYLAGTGFPEFATVTHFAFNPIRQSTFAAFEPTDTIDPLRRNTMPPSQVGVINPFYYDVRTTWWMPNPANPQPLFDHNSPAATYDTTRNEYFRLQKRQRMANLTTQRSSVFAIWVTVGYFELEEVAIAVPDDPTANLASLSFSAGNVEIRTAIGEEYGVERGTVRRDRAFYVVDRSIPVGFIPGQNLNVDKAVLTKRYIP